MILIPEPCEHCGQIEVPSEIACDTCSRVHDIGGFDGIVVRFGYEEEPPEDTLENLTSNIDIPLGCEFHFCDVKCLAEYINDQSKNKFDMFEDKSLGIFLESQHVGLVLYALGKVDWD